MPQITYPGLVPFCIPTKDEEGNDFSEWDGSTLDGGLNPSKHANKNVTVYGSGSYYCIKLTRHQVAELYWRAKGIVTEVEVSSDPIATGSGSASGDWNNGSGGSTGNVYTPNWEAEEASLTLSQCTLSEMLDVGFTCNASYPVDPDNPDGPQVCDTGTLHKGDRLLSDVYRKRILRTYHNGGYFTDDDNPSETGLVCGPPIYQWWSWQTADFLGSDDSSISLPAFASFIDSTDVNTYSTYSPDGGWILNPKAYAMTEHGAASVYFSMNTDVISLGLFNYGSAGNYTDNNLPVLRVDAYFPNFQFIQTEPDEYWWNPALTVLSAFILMGNSGGYDHSGGDGNAAYTSLAAKTIAPRGWTPDARNPPPPITDPSLNGTNIESVTIELTFADGSIVTGEQFLLQQVTNGTDSDGNPTAGSSVSITSPNGRCTVDMSIDPSVLIPDKISLSFNKYYTYGGFYDEDTGLPA
jgi:hypothetical protein